MIGARAQARCKGMLRGKCSFAGVTCVIGKTYGCAEPATDGMHRPWLKASQFTCDLQLRYVAAGCSGLFSVSASQAARQRSKMAFQPRSGKATVCGLGRSKCEPGAVPKAADCGSQP